MPTIHPLDQVEYVESLEDNMAEPQLYSRSFS